MADHVAVVEGQNSGLVLSDAAYDNLRRVVEKLLPAIGLLYAAFATAWGWGYVAQVSASLAALAVFGGVLLTFARKGYAPPVTIGKANYDGQVVSDVIDGQPALRIELNEDSTQNLLNKQNLLIKGVTTE
ncbi:hypothetical protein SEA_DJUNGELSKOG_30 [Arthrobacter phage Djungelskog]|nr:membrane protein [Arthrobacter phage MrAaronian]WNO27635.1 hypothetical protein SEA_DJUNGELSKOG_30 [Arthrobacter phage Djungelskog]